MAKVAPKKCLFIFSKSFYAVKVSSLRGSLDMKQSLKLK